MFFFAILATVLCAKFNSVFWDEPECEEGEDSTAFQFVSWPLGVHLKTYLENEGHDAVQKDDFCFEINGASVKYICNQEAETIRLGLWTNTDCSGDPHEEFGETPEALNWDCKFEQTDFKNFSSKFLCEKEVTMRHAHFAIFVDTSCGGGNGDIEEVDVTKLQAEYYYLVDHCIELDTGLVESSLMITNSSGKVWYQVFLGGECEGSPVFEKSFDSAHECADQVYGDDRSLEHIEHPMATGSTLFVGLGESSLYTYSDVNKVSIHLGVLLVLLFSLMVCF